ncbi:MAG: transcription antitermination factor NusB [Candidatus Theseobacter exili]|nr:transcription antitermination factor NusB [Candidatus Theseobacter exili]
MTNQLQKSTRRKARIYALQMIFQNDINPIDTEVGVADFYNFIEAKKEVRKFAEELFNLTMDNLDKIDEFIIATATNWSLHRITAVDRNLLRLAVCELLFRDDIPYAVSINEAVEIAKSFSSVESGKFVNGILDNIRKKIEAKENK